MQSAIFVVIRSTLVIGWRSGTQKLRETVYREITDDAYYKRCNDSGPEESTAFNENLQVIRVVTPCEY